MKRYIQIAAIIATITFASCAKNIPESFQRKAEINGTTVVYEMSRSPKTYVYEDIFDETDGLLSVRAKHTFNGTSGFHEYWVSNILLDKTNSPTTSIDGGLISTGIDGQDPVNQEFDIASEGRQYISSVSLESEAEIVSTFWGNNIAFSLDGNSSTGVPQLQQELYIPLEIELTAPDPSSMIATVGATGSEGIPNYDIANSLQVTWNQDNSNENGIVIIVNWDGMVFNPTIGRGEFTDGYSNYYVITDDDGSYTLDNSIFAELGADKMITVSILRGNIEIIEESSKTYSFYGLTESTTTHILLVD
jgi:hypothetical protein